MPLDTLPPIRCQHRWRSGPTYPYPNVPTVAGDDGWKELDVAIETGICKRCGGARKRMFSRQREHFVSSWDHAESFAELILGRPLNESEERFVLTKIGLN